MTVDYYGILELDPKASQEEIKKKYRELAKKYHPDVSPETADKFEEIQEAYSVLSDLDKKAAYDESIGLGNGLNSMDLFDLEYPQKGKRTDVYVNLTFREALNGCTKDVEYQLEKAECPSCHGKGVDFNQPVERCDECIDGWIYDSKVRHRTILNPSGLDKKKCPKCNGTGYKIYTKCPTCDGVGVIGKTVRTTVNFPAGIDEDDIVPLRNQGEPGKHGGERGDVDIHVIIGTEDGTYKIGSDLIKIQEVPLSTLILGTEVTGEKVRIPLSSGKNALASVSSMTGAMSRKKAGGAGAPSKCADDTNGDLYIHFVAKIPESKEELRNELQKILDKLDD